MRHNVFKFFVVFGLMVGLVVVTGTCKKNEDVNTDDAYLTQLEETTAYTAATVASLGGTIFESAFDIVAGNPSKADSIQGRTYSYNEATGWWSFYVALLMNQTAAVNVRFLEASGNFHKYFAPTVTTIQTNGSVSGTDAACTYEFTISNISFSSRICTVDGTGTATYKDINCAFSVDGMEKIGTEGIPKKGSVTMTGNGGATIKVTFNGSTTVKVTYSYQGHSRTFNVNLLTGAVS